MKKLGFVIPWFGEKIPGGAEMELRGLTGAYGGCRNRAGDPGHLRKGIYRRLECEPLQRRTHRGTGHPGAPFPGEKAGYRRI